MPFDIMLTDDGINIGAVCGACMGGTWGICMGATWGICMGATWGICMGAIMGICIGAAWGICIVGYVGYDIIGWGCIIGCCIDGPSANMTVTLRIMQLNIAECEHFMVRRGK